ncbi:hypothetical protein tpqmel_0800 [Candidatus Gastranaerophilus sp. (ex Termes propinquus)]|nr:hypothetical protein tpqmel_0800 [Candidatus Gastranaerophilus sp. (ex Termes propinquus)]
MAMLENTRVVSFDRADIQRNIQTPEKPQFQAHNQVGQIGQIGQIGQSKGFSGNSDLDVLYKNIDKTLTRVTSTQFNKTPGAYLGIGFVAGLIVMFVISLIVALVSNDAKVHEPKKAAVTVVSADNTPKEAPVTVEEKYVIKSGDTLDGIAYRFYGKYDEGKIKQIQALNNITSPSSLQIGQVLIVPVDR